MNRQGAYKSMSWLVSIIESETDTLDALPLNCLSQLLLQLFQQFSTRQFTYLPKLYSRVINFMNSDLQLVSDTLNYFLSKLISSSQKERDASKKCLHLILLYYSMIRSHSSIHQDLAFFTSISNSLNNT